MSEQVLPFYLVCDESYSMDGAPLQAINQELPTIYDEIASNPVVADKARLGIIGFSTGAEILLPLADLNDVQSIPQLSARGMTNYGAAFSLLRDTIEMDIKKLRQAGHSPYRPTVFFLTDGHPTDEWNDDYQRLVDPGFGPHPSILAFGFGEAQASILTQIATFRAFIANGDVSPTQALREFAKQLLNSVVKSAVASSSSPAGEARLVVPEQVTGYTVLPVDLV
ncbi:VWA domain-containing protein [Sphaerisporangium album]|uniref:VWA domain-containing protein n=1 Tax=Sphaerisporangium album TaxID=509200 RepID=A0A367FQS3_9ACTN|nr:VWA domain-containing protein [Sphaerisporangium album]RCG32733.1 VWA domain-containing protein [Sphaerisporangium album]